MSRVVSKGGFYVVKDGDLAYTYDFQFNPTHRTTNHSVEYDLVRPPGSSLPLASFGNIQGATFNLSVFLDATNGYSEARQGTRADKAFFECLVSSDVDSLDEELMTFTAPPLVTYSMGGENFPVLVLSCKAEDLMFNSKGIEVRTTLDLDLQVYLRDPNLLKARLEKLKRLRDLVIVR